MCAENFIHSSENQHSYRKILLPTSPKYKYDLKLIRPSNKVKLLFVWFFRFTSTVTSTTSFIFLIMAKCTKMALKCCRIFRKFNFVYQSIQCFSMMLLLCFTCYNKQNKFVNIVFLSTPNKYDKYSKSLRATTKCKANSFGSDRVNHLLMQI